MNRKIVFTCFTALSIVVAMITTSASEPNLDIERNLEASKQLAEVKKAIASQRSDNVYAGAWIDDNNIPHIAFTTVPNVTLSQELKDRKIQIEQLSNTYAELISFQENVSSHQHLYSVIETFVNESDNSLNVKYTDKSKLVELKTYISELNEKNIDVNYTYSDDILENNALQGGDAITYNGGSCSIGFRAKKGETYGYVTAGHCFPVGASINGGTVVSRVWSASSNMDAEFVNANVGRLVPNSDRQGTSYTVNDISVSQGSYVKAASWVSTRTGTITSTSASTSFTNDGTYTNLFLCSGGSIGGMSGGVNISGSYAIGITKGGTSTNRYVVKAGRILNSLGLSTF